MLRETIHYVFGALKKAILPDRKDLLGSLILTIPAYILLGLSLIFLLPLIIAGVIVVYVLRRIWKAALLYITYRLFRKKASNHISSIKKILK
jgi:hypothetical protein